MSELHIKAETIIPETPKIVDKEKIFVYAPAASYNIAGLASFAVRDFVLNKGKVSIRNKIDKAIKNLFFDSATNELTLEYSDNIIKTIVLPVLADNSKLEHEEFMLIEFSKSSWIPDNVSSNYVISFDNNILKQVDTAYVPIIESIDSISIDTGKLDGYVNVYTEYIKTLDSLTILSTQPFDGRIIIFSNRALDLHRFKENIVLLQSEINNKVEVNKRNITQNSNKISALENALISAGTIDKRSSIMTEEKQQTGGTDLSGLTVLDESYATVNKISGNTVSSKNLLDIDKMVDGNALVKNSDGSYTFTIASEEFATSSSIVPCDIPAGNYFFNVDIVSDSISPNSVQLRYQTDDGIYYTALFPNAPLVVTRKIITLSIFAPYAAPTGSITFRNPMLNVNISPIPYQPYFEDIKNAKISGIKSSGRNLLTLDYMVATDDGDEWTNALVKNSDGTFTISKNGTNRFSKKWACDIPAGTYTVFWEIGDYKNTTGVETTGSPTLRFFDKNKTEISTQRLYLTSWKKSQKTFSEDVKYIDMVMNTNCSNGDYVTIKKIMIYKGLENPLPPYMPYGVESTLQFPKTIELGKWDYIDFEKKEIVRKTGKIELLGEESMWSMNGGQYIEMYPNMSQFAPPSGAYYTDIVVNNGYTVITDYTGNATGKAVNLDAYGILSIRDPDYMSINDADPEESVRNFRTHLRNLFMDGKPLTIYIELATETREPIDIDNTYIVWNKGFEQVLTPEDENGLTCFDYGANITEENEYMILLGGTN